MEVFIKQINIIDTNILMYNPSALMSFPNQILVIPLVVIEELDKHKNKSDIGHNARAALRQILDVVESEQSKEFKIKDHDYLSNKNIHHYKKDNVSYKFIMEESSIEAQNDDKILSIAVEYQKNCPEYKVKLLTRDSALRIKASFKKIIAEDFDVNTKKLDSVDSVYTGYRTVLFNAISNEDLKCLLDKQVPLISKDFINEFELLPNEYIFFKKDKVFATYRYNHKSESLVLVTPKSAFELKGKNREQWIALDALLDPDISFVTLCGAAGSGKTLLAIAAGLQQALETNTYKEILISRPVQPLGKDIGYLPGDIQEKMLPWMIPIIDNLNILSANKNRIKTMQDVGLAFNKLIEIEPLTYIRGRTIINSFLIVDEAQNLSPHMAKTILTRAGNGTKIIFTGDPDQIDDPYLNSVNNGLVQSIELFKELNQGQSAHIMLTHVERSDLADLATKLFKQK